MNENGRVTPEYYDAYVYMYIIAVIIALLVYNVSFFVFVIDNIFNAVGGRFFLNRYFESISRLGVSRQTASEVNSFIGFIFMLSVFYFIWRIFLDLKYKDTKYSDRALLGSFIIFMFCGYFIGTADFQPRGSVISLSIANSFGSSIAKIALMSVGFCFFASEFVVQALSCVRNSKWMTKNGK